jgi:hypothetical protein
MRAFAPCTVALILVLGACGEQVPTDPNTVVNDVCENDFATCVMPIMSSQIRREGGAFVSCMDGNCHAQGGSGGRFTLGPDNAANFRAASNLINLASPSDSLLLVEPTNDAVAPSAVAGTHGGGNIFPTTSDQCYAAISAWISNNGGSCGLCTQVANPTTTCGYP